MAAQLRPLLPVAANGGGRGQPPDPGGAPDQPPRRQQRVRAYVVAACIPCRSNKRKVGVLLDWRQLPSHGWRTLADRGPTSVRASDRPASAAASARSRASTAPRPVRRRRRRSRGSTMTPRTKSTSTTSFSTCCAGYPVEAPTTCCGGCGRESTSRQSSTT